MGKRGPAPTPTIKLLERGSTVPGRRGGGEPEPKLGRPEPPAGMSESERAIYDQVCDVAERMGVLSVSDGFPLERYANMLIRWRASTQWIRENGECYPIYQTDKDGNVCIGPDGEPLIRYMQQSPQVSIVKSLNAALLRIEQEFGLTPSARTNIRIDTKPAGGGIASRARGA